MITVSSRYFFSAIAVFFAISTSATAQSAFQYAWAARAPSHVITNADIREALIWTGYLQPTALADPDGTLRAAHAWQTAKRYPLTEAPTQEQAVELVYEGLRIRDSFGWAMLRDDSIGFSVGFPSKLTSFEPPRPEGSMMWYRGQGAVAYGIGVKYGGASCNNIPFY